MFAKKALAASVSAGPATYIEDVFSTYLYTGTGASQTITNNIDISTNGGLVWIKGRSGATAHRLTDTVRGATKSLESNSSATDSTESTGLTAFGTTGFTIGADADYNTNTATYVSWTFRKQAKFFDVVTYTGNASSRTIAHNLGSVPGTIIVKCTSEANDWVVYHRSLSTPASSYLKLNTTDAVITGNTNIWNNTAPTSSVFSVGASGFTNNTGQTYVAYLFAHDAGGFGAAGTDNVITCGSYTGNGGANTITLGYEPQWLLVKKTSVQDSTSFWSINDNMRGGLTARGTASQIKPNSTEAEDDLGGVTTLPAAIATGFTIGNAGGYNASGETYIYIAIRRPMKTPTSGTSVFSPVTYVGDGSTTAGQLVNAGFAVDMGINRYNRGGAGDWDIVDRLRGLTSIGVSSNSKYLNPYNTSAEASGGYIFDATNTGVDMYGFSASFTQLNYLFRRAPGFFDVVCYTGNGSTQSVSHNLTVAPELIIVKWRSGGATAYGWRVYHADLGITKWGQFTNDAFSTASSPYPWDTPTSSVFKLGDGSTWLSINGSSKNFVAYLFASVSGVSKVGSYTGNGSNQTINCGFTAGARFVMIKRTDSTGDWFVYDTARGIVSGNDPQLKLNTTDAEATGYDAIDPDNSGFIVNNDATNFPINVNSATYIYLAIA
jgi:hypothetical protein